MNSDGHLVDMGCFSAEEQRKFREGGYEPVPDELSIQARLELMGKSETHIGLNASGSLSKHVRYLRKKKQQIEKASRRKNRCHQR